LLIGSLRRAHHQNAQTVSIRYLAAMNFESMTHLEAVARHRSFINAADALHISQSAVSRSIQALERELGARLFDRRPHHVELTGFGSFVLERVRGLISSQQQMNREIEQFKGIESGYLHVGFGPLTAETLAGPTVARFLNEHPRIRLRLAFLATDEMAEALFSGRIDVLVGEPTLKKPQPDLIQTELKRRKGFFYCRARHPLLAKKSPKFSDLAQYPFVGFALPPRIARMAEAAVHFGHIDPATGHLIPQVECYSVATAKRIVADSDGIGAATYSMVRDELHEGLLAAIPLTLPGMETAYSIITLRGRTPTPAVLAYINVVRAIDHELDEARPHRS
jgi:DNA-binding transcriptional LysR family regulator